MSNGTASKMKLGLFREFSAAVLRQLPDDLDSTVAQGWIENQESLRRVLRVALEPMVGKSTPVFTYDKTKDGWKLVENVAESMDFKIKELQMISFLRGSESYVNGEEMRRRSIEMKCNFGQQPAEYLLANQDQIPKEFRKNVLVFPGTVWQSPNGYRCVPYLYWDGDRWSLVFGWLDGVWNDLCRLLQPRK